MKLSRFATYAWGVLAYNLLVILWGAFMRATGSGAGCGSHWPVCNGEIIPQAPAIATMIEFSHRATSGIALLLVVGLIVWAFRAYPKGSPIRLGAILSMAFIISEALVGAGLVIFGLTADNDSVARAIVIAIHLVNTLMLVGALTLTAWWASGGTPMQVRGQGSVAVLLGAGLLGMLLLAMSGAITALGDTLFPAESLSQGLAQDFAPGAHFLERLRVWHPVLAVTLGVYLVTVARITSGLRPSRGTKRSTLALTVLFVIQLVIGSLNVALLAPVWMQLVHLLLADFVWIALVLLTACALVAQPAQLPLEDRVAVRTPGLGDGTLQPERQA